MTKSLLEPILEGIQQTQFFNGRLLSAEDLAREQLANRDARRRLGRTIGEGVAWGLDVVETRPGSSKENPIVTIKAGAAINRRGEVLELFKDIDLSLIGGGTERPAAPSGFNECEPPTASGFTVGEGAYALVIGPTAGREGRAPTSGLGNVTASCNARYTVEGVRFRLVEIRPGQDVLDDAGQLRNRLAYYCFGTTTAQLPPIPFPPAATSYGVIDGLRGKTLTDCDVPLAVIFWTKAGGIEFIDMWAVRRRISTPSASPAWDVVFSDRLDSEAEAMFLQFQDHIEDIAMGMKDGAIEMKAHFAFLPPMGLVPLETKNGFSAEKFFGKQVWDQKFDMDGRVMRPVLRAAQTLFGSELIDLSSPHILQVFRVFERLGGEQLRGANKGTEGPRIIAGEVRERRPEEATKDQKTRSYALFLGTGTTVVPIQEPPDVR
jgi:hypothetical protein